MARAAVMQPYLLPYLGYFHLMAAVDTFVVLDDVQFVKHRWMNRNRVLVGDEVRWLTLPVRSAPLATTIRDKRYALDDESIGAFEGLLRTAYGAAPGWAKVVEVVARVRAAATDRVSELDEALLLACLGQLGIEPPTIVRSSDLATVTADAPDAVSRVIALCHAVGADTYVNLPGGRELYDAETFGGGGLELLFVESDLRPYDQGGREFMPALSVVDALAWCADDAASLVAPDAFRLLP